MLDLLAAMMPELGIVGGPAIRHRTAEIARRGGEIGIGVGEQALEKADALPELAGLQEGQAVLRDQQATGFQAAGAVGVELAW